MVVFNGDQATCNLSSSPIDINWTPAKLLNTQSATCVSLHGCLPTLPAAVSNHFHVVGSGAWWIMWKTIAPHSTTDIHIDWCWHLANALAFSRMKEHWHASSSCGLGRSPNVFPLPSSATQMFRSNSPNNPWRSEFSGLVVLLVAIWLDSEWIYRSVNLIRFPCILAFWAVPIPTSSRCRVDVYGRHTCLCVVSLYALQLLLHVWQICCLYPKRKKWIKFLTVICE